MRRELIEAAKDYRYLLDRGYPQKASLNIVSSKYLLSLRERLIIYRCIHSSNYVRSVLSRRGVPQERDLVVIDGYNVLTTVYSALHGEELYLCDDGFIRDLMGIKQKASIVVDRDFIDIASRILVNHLAGRRLSIVLDAGVSHSGLLAQLLRERIYGAEVIAVQRADKELLLRSSNGWVASSDALILSGAPRVFDLGGEIARESSPKKIVILPLSTT